MKPILKVSSGSKTLTPDLKVMFKRLFLKISCYKCHQSRDRLPDKVDPFKVVLMVSAILLDGRCNNDCLWQGPDQGEEVPVKDDWSVLPHLGHLLHQLLLLRWAEHLASLAIAYHIKHAKGCWESGLVCHKFLH